jgi:type IV pilus assembly protein PilZ
LGHPLPLRGTVAFVDSSDRRTSQRAAIVLNVEYKRVNTFFADYTRNISKGGTFIKTDRPLQIGTEFVFALTIRTVPEPLKLRGRVRWVVTTEQATPDQPAGMGIEFLYATDEERRTTEAIVERLMSQELGDTLTNRLLGKRGE